MAQTLTDGMKALTALRQEVNRRRDPGPCAELTPIDGDGFSVRYFGDWEVPRDEEDDGDYDWKVPTAATRRMLDALVARFPGTAWTNEGEKCWLRFHLK